LAVT